MDDTNNRAVRAVRIERATAHYEALDMAHECLKAAWRAAERCGEHHEYKRGLQDALGVTGALMVEKRAQVEQLRTGPEWC